MKFVIIVNLNEGDQFDELNGHKICNKYETPATRRQAAQKRKSEQKYKVFFPKYADTGHLKREWQNIPVGARIYISEKLHGTSARYGHLLLEKQKWPKLYGLFRLLHLPVPMESKWQHINGSRNVTLIDGKTGGFYGSDAFRFHVTEDVYLHKQEIIFGEIVGYYDIGSPIMATQTTKGLKDKAISKLLGDTVTYKYGCLDGECDFYVYHIVMVNDDGHVFNYTHDQVIGRCSELGLKVVPDLIDFPYYTGNREALLQVCDRLVQDDEDSSNVVMSTIDPSHLIEGVVVRWGHEGKVGWQKYKGWLFSVLEGIVKENPDVVDIEEAS